MSPRKNSTAASTPAPLSAGEEAFALHLRADELTAGLDREYQFASGRKWRFDFAWPAQRIAVEIEGVTGGEGGRHQRIAGYEKDLEKYNTAVSRGWKVFRFTPGMVKRGEAIKLMRMVFETVY